jgi:chitodextrinase
VTPAADGTATFKLPAGLAGGAHAMSVAYSGSEQLEPVQAPVTVTVNLPAAWSAAAVYNTGDRVSYQGKVFQASYYAHNQKPGDPNGPWQEIAMTEDGDTLWTPSRIFNAGDKVGYDGHVFKARWYTRNQKPGDPNGPWRLV